MSILDQHRARLEALTVRDRLRRLIPRTGIDFSSNDYLGLATSRVLRIAVQDAIERGVAVGAGGSRLLRGNDPEHEALEAEATTFFGSESALYFANGFAANSTLFAALPDRRDLIVHDALIHASVHDGMRLSFAEKVSAAHNDAQAFDDAIAGWRAKGSKGRPWIAVESLYSMDGDCAPIADLVAVAERHEAFLVIDEAHAVGVFGPQGRGLASDIGSSENVIRLATCGKALGSEGALVLASQVIVDTLLNSGRGFIFSTAPSPLMAAAVRASVGLLQQQPERGEMLHRQIALANGLFGSPGGTHIIPIIIGDDGDTMHIAARLQRAGFDVRGIRPPTVPTGTSRLRVSITLNAGEADIEALAGLLKEFLP
jgi:8-amino-7-oxononanoate synthase